MKGLKDTINSIWHGAPVNKEVFSNIFNEAFFKYIGGRAASYDNKASTYLKEGFGTNPDVFTVVRQMCDKTKAVPFYVKKIKDNQEYSNLKALQAITKGNYNHKQYVDKRLIETKAYEERSLKFPMERPNPNQTWIDIWDLYKLFLKLTGNVYFLKLAPKEGVNAGVPKLFYVLPSHKIKIVVKKDVDVISDPDPIDYYMLTDGDQNIRFPKENVIHIKTANPFFDFNGSHLYGLSPVAALLKNLESSNEALSNNVKMMKNSGVFGLISGKDRDGNGRGALSPDQAQELKGKLLEMDKASGRLSKITTLSAPVEFTKLSLDTKELLPFDYLKYDQKQICNVFGWSDSLLNNDDGGKYDKQQQERKRVVTDNIHPDLVLLQETLTHEFIRLFKGYENSVLEFDVSELSEMQQDMAELVKWMKEAYYTPNEIRIATKAESLKIDGMDTVWINAGMKRIDDVGITASDVTKSYDMLKNSII